MYEIIFLSVHMDRIEAILNYWFEGIDDTTVINTKELPFKKWFIKDEKMDAQIRQQFESDLLAASRGQYKDWEDASLGRLALIILYDQFSRNMYRDTEKMYAFDALALELTLRTIDEGKDLQWMLIQRTFVYLPLMHSEDLKVQQKSVKSYEKLLEESKIKNAANAHYYEYTLNYAKEHHDSIAKFGRFPYRDAVLKRV